MRKDIFHKLCQERVVPRAICCKRAIEGEEEKHARGRGHTSSSSSKMGGRCLQHTNRAPLPESHTMAQSLDLELVSMQNIPLEALHGSQEVGDISSNPGKHGSQGKSKSSSIASGRMQSSSRRTFSTTPNPMRCMAATLGDGKVGSKESAAAAPSLSFALPLHAAFNTPREPVKSTISASQQFPPTK